MKISDYGRWIKEERTKRGISQKELAAMSCMTPQGLCQIESGKRNPAIASLEALTGALGYEIRVEMKEESND